MTGRRICRDRKFHMLMAFLDPNLCRKTHFDKSRFKIPILQNKLKLRPLLRKRFYANKFSLD